MKKTLLALIFAIIVPVQSASSADGTTIYLIRHAERAEDGTDDPPLSEIGTERARVFAEIFKGDQVTHVFSTPYIRTMRSAGPTADEHGLTIEDYNPSDLAGFAESLKNLQGTILVVGHSNTTPTLVNLLTGSDLDNLDEQIYDRVYIVNIDKDRRAVLRIDYTEPRTPAR